MTVRVGLQLYSVRNSLARDNWATLARLAEAGFTHLEAVNHNARNDPGVGFGVDAQELRSQLANLGLSIVGCHINPLELDILPRALDYQSRARQHPIRLRHRVLPVRRSRLRAASIRAVQQG